jgi:preprotein translocase subunit SecA
MFALERYADPYPQRRDWQEFSWLDRMGERLRASLRVRLYANALRQRYFVRQVTHVYKQLQAIDDEALDSYLATLRRELRRDGLTDHLVARAFALISLFSGRVLGMTHYPVQLRAGYLMVLGYMVEMDTGEGKTLTATLAAATAALAGVAVHVVTVNDYLATRDHDLLKPLYERLGLTTGLVGDGMPEEEKRIEYKSDITYCTNKTLVFDYLRDRIEHGDRMGPMAMAYGALAGDGSHDALLPGLQFAIVDEADSVFIDEARTPLVISASRQDPAAESFFHQAIALAGKLQQDVDFKVSSRNRMPGLSARGKEKLGSLGQDMNVLWHAEHHREEAVQQALVALHTFTRDVHYIIRDQLIMIVDENTGRVMPDRSWERGLQQLIEAKEGVPITPEKDTLARISFQLFFRRYLRLAGMSGTCHEVRGEIAEVFGLGVVRVPPHRRSQRLTLVSRVYPEAAQRWCAVVDVIIENYRLGRPVLVGTRSIRASEELHDYLLKAGIDHYVLNAKQDAEEADIVYEAGKPGRVTIATNMAGRGTDIKLGESVEALGGLHVILTEGHDTLRVDRQLAGRCARQGEKGSWQAILSLEDEVVKEFLRPVNRLLSLALKLFPNSRLIQAAALGYYRLAQWRLEGRNRRLRHRLLHADFQQRKSLSFSGQME